MLFRIWILFSSLIVALGWVSSPFKGVTPATYGIFFILFCIGVIKHYRSDGLDFVPFYRVIRRLFSLQRLLPGIFAFSALLLLIKGLETAPSHGDGLCYRIPRVMHWIFEQQWHWIPAQDDRLNNRGTVSEWLTVPILMFFRTDYLVFLPNWISYLFFPGMVFSIWRYFGVPSKLAWIAMWLLPSGFCFSLQACNCSNDILATFYVLAAIYLVVKAGQNTSWGDVALSCLCIALATGVKVSSVVYCLPWIIAVAPKAPILLRKPVASLLMLALALLISFFPTSVQDYLHGAGWTGLLLEPRFVAPPVIVGLVGNFFLIVTQNLIPPLFNSTHTFAVIHSMVSASNIGILINHYFEPDSLYYYRQIVVEQAGLGFVVCLMIAVIYIGTSSKTRGLNLRKRLTEGWSIKRLVMSAVWVAFVYSLAIANTNQPARLVCTFYPLLLPAFFGQRDFTSGFFWKFCKYLSGIAILLGACLILVFETNPLIPLIANTGSPEGDDSVLRQVAARAIPPTERAVGIIRFWNQHESWLWQPYGSRQVMELAVEPNRQEVQTKQIHYVFISEEMLATHRMDISTWVDKENATGVAMIMGGYYMTWYLVKLNP